MDTCGSGHHKRCKKNARARFDRCTNDERIRQQANNENIGVLQQPRCTDGPTLPRLWQKVGESQYCKVEIGHNGSCQISSSVRLDKDSNWTIFVGENQVPRTCPVLDGFSPSLPTSEDLPALQMMLFLCPGTQEEKFIAICQARGGVVKGARGCGATVAFIDLSSPVFDSSGSYYQCTVRRVDCDILCERSGQYPSRCKLYVKHSGQLSAHQLPIRARTITIIHHPVVTPNFVPSLLPNKMIG